MGEWKEVILEDVVSILGDGLHGTPNYDDNGDYYFINGNNLSDGKIVIKEGTKRANKYEYEKYKKNLNEKTILVSINGTIGNVALYNNEKCILGKSACYFNVKDEIERNFIKYVVTNKNFQEYLHNFANGTTIKNVSLNSMREYPFLLPPISEQQSIASILSSLDDKIDLLYRQNKTLEQLAETLFRQWFVEEADESWEEVKLKTLCEIITKGTTPTTLGKQFVSTGINFLKVESLTEDGDFIESKFAHIDLETDKLLSRSRIQADDVLITIAGTIGRVAVVPERILPSNTNQAIAIVRVKKELLNPLLIYLLLKSPIIINDFESRVVHAVQPNLSLGEIGDISFRLPPQESLIEYSNKINLVFSKKEKNYNQIRTLTQLCDTLLPKLMSGEIRLNLD